MNIKTVNSLKVIVIFLLLSAFNSSSNNLNNPPQKRELRGVWIASVANIDWPSKSGLSSAQQQQEVIDILDKHQKIGLNAVFMQVRAASDAFYAQSMEPWSEWLTGVQGRAPNPFYDPLEFFIKETHERNMEFHAWLNLNRGTHGASRSISLDHITRNHPEWFITHNGTKFYNLGLPEVRNYIVHLVLNIVRNYDIDGIHFDDYFYPYPAAGHKINDQETFRKYGSGFNNIADWRRDNINQLIKSLSSAIEKEKPYVKFGISPFGVWRNQDKDRHGSPSKRALSSYDDLYADSKLWITEGWIDYIIPQIYWSFENQNTPYKTMVNWWAKNHGNRHLYIGVAGYRVGSESRNWQGSSQLLRQAKDNLKNEAVSGTVYFSSKSLVNNNSGISDSLQKIYQYPALPPLMPWKKGEVLPSPKVTHLVRHKSGNMIRIRWDIPKQFESSVSKYVIYRFKQEEYKTIDNPANIIAIIKNTGEKEFIDETVNPDQEYLYAITTLDRLSNESKPSKLYRLSK